MAFVRTDFNKSGNWMPFDFSFFMNATAARATARKKPHCQMLAGCSQGLGASRLALLADRAAHLALAADR